MEQFSFFIEPCDASKRLDVFLSEELADFSRNSVQKLIENGKVLVNNKQQKSNYKLKALDFLQVETFEPVALNIEPENIPLCILYEDDDLIVVDKQQGMVVHPAVGHYSGTLVNALLFHCKNSLSGINGIMRPGIVHRIDKDTSGVIVVAKNNVAHVHLAKQLAEHTMLRKYYAIVLNNIKEDSGTIEKPIGRHPVERKKMCVTQLDKGKHAVTHFKVLERLTKNKSGTQSYTFIEVKLETGRTHQIRVHMSYIGHPLLGDLVYGSSKQAYKLNGQVLHAKVLGFVHPTKGEFMQFESELPTYFSEILERFS